MKRLLVCTQLLVWSTAAFAQQSPEEESPRRALAAQRLQARAAQQADPAFVQRAHGAGAIIGTTPANYLGSATGTRWNANELALIDTGALSSLPGNANGAPASGVLGASRAYAN